jgi:5,10-methenyltetrahydrofolate synthetase
MTEWAEIAAWRKRVREQRIAAREALAPEARREATAAIGRLIEALLSPARLRVIAFCWPYRAEVDVRFAIRALRAAGAMAALPVVVGRGQALAFREWHPGVAMRAGALGIPAPVDTALVEPDAALVPLVAFDAQGCRLGYGGGFFDRTLAALSRRPLAIGVGFEAQRLPTIHPQPHDIPMDFIVTESGVGSVESGALRPVSLDAAAARACRLVAERK